MITISPLNRTEWLGVQMTLAIYSPFCGEKG